MIYDDERKKLIAIRLSELRKAAGLTFEGLAERLTQKYGDANNADGKYIISVAALKKYERIDVPDEKSKFGMNIQFLIMFSDFYNVSPDYILGLTDSKLPNIEDRAIKEKIGLSDKAIKVLSKWKSANDDNFGYGSRDLRALNALLDETYNIMEQNPDCTVNSIFGQIGLYLYGEFEHDTATSIPLSQDVLNDPVFQMNKGALFISEKGKDNYIAYDVNKVMKAFVLEDITNYIRKLKKGE